MPTEVIRPWPSWTVRDSAAGIAALHAETHIATVCDGDRLTIMKGTLDRKIEN